MITIVPYQVQWVAEFQQLGTSLRQALGSLASRIDHIGSTSVPGLGAKDVIDIQVTVAGLFPKEPLMTAFLAAGYEMRDDIQEDHRPAGNKQPASEWQKRYCGETQGKRRIHIHVRVASAANQRYALLFRDFLRSNHLAAGSYEQIKRELARLHPDDTDAYYAVKDPACDLIIAAAEEWATYTGWKASPADA